MEFFSSSRYSRVMFGSDMMSDFFLTIVIRHHDTIHMILKITEKRILGERIRLLVQHHT